MPYAKFSMYLAHFYFISTFTKYSYSKPTWKIRECFIAFLKRNLGEMGETPCIINKATTQNRAMNYLATSVAQLEDREMYLPRRESQRERERETHSEKKNSELN